MDKEKLDMVLHCIFMCVLIMSLAYCQAHVESARINKTYVVQCDKGVK